MVNVKAEYPEDHKSINNNLKFIHKEQDFFPEVKEFKITKREEEYLAKCTNTEVDIIALTSGVVAKIPVVLAALTVQINVSSLIELSKPIFQIKEIIKKANIDQCTLMQYSNTLFIKGYINKDISYYTVSTFKEKEIWGEVQSLAVKVPFSCTTHVNYNILKPEETIKSTIKESNYIVNNDNTKNDMEADEGVFGKISYEESNLINQVVTEYYNELPYCEIVSSTIVETESFLETNSIQKNLEQRERIYAIEGEGIINLKIRVLQKRLVSIPKI
ncbi:MAG: hypothetical protein WDA24_04255 [Tissierellales bacterium]